MNTSEISLTGATAVGSMRLLDGEPVTQKLNMTEIEDALNLVAHFPLGQNDELMPERQKAMDAMHKYCNKEKLETVWDAAARILAAKVILLRSSENERIVKLESALKSAARIIEGTYQSWGASGGAPECPHGYNVGIPCRTCDIKTVTLMLNTIK